MAEITVKNALAKLTRLRQVTGGAIGTDDGRLVEIDHAKADQLEAVLDQFDEPAIVFAQFHFELDAIRRVVARLGRECLELSGRNDELKRWQAGEAPVLAVQIDAGGVGVDLTRARYAIYYSVGFSLGAYLQSLARVHRPGQTRPVTYIHLIAKGTIDEKIMKALAAREEVVESVLRQMKEEQ
jgi:SNF2 family DNA or RNA helicase